MSKGLSEQELDALIGAHDYRLFLNPRNDLYRERNMKEHPPSRKEAIALMSQNPNLVRRPLFARGNKVQPGFDPDIVKEFLK